MRVLLVKTSSLGDIIHTFPALTDAIKHNPSLKFDWVTEEAFRQIPLLHPTVDHVFPIALRRWRRKLWHPHTWGQIYSAIQGIRLESYDIILDAQGLMKSSLLSLFAKGKRYGYAWNGAREPLASIFYHQKFPIPWPDPEAPEGADDFTSIRRNRILFARTFGYPTPKTPTDTGLLKQWEIKEKTILFLPGASRDTKKWPVEYWAQLARLMGTFGFTVTIPWSTEEELREARQIRLVGSHVHILEKMSLGDLANIIRQHKLAVAVDSGLGYLAAAFQIPTFILWGATSPKMIGQFDHYQFNIISSLWCSPCAKRECQHKELSQIQPPCLAEISPELVFRHIENYVERNNCDFS